MGKQTRSYIYLINKTGANSVKGTLAAAHDTIDDAYELVPIGDPDPLGVVVSDGVADGGLVKIQVTGIAEVFFVGNVTHGYFARMTTGADSGAAAGKAIAEAIPTSPFASDKHFQEIGHCLQSRTGAGLARVIIHFN